MRMICASYLTVLDKLLTMWKKKDATNTFKMFRNVSRREG